MKRSILLVALFILILIPALVPGAAQAKGFGSWLRATQMLPPPQDAAKNITKERFSVDSVGADLQNNSPFIISTSCVYQKPKFFDPMVKNSVVFRNMTYRIDIFPGERYPVSLPVVFDFVKKTQYPRSVSWGTGLWNKQPGKKISINLQRNVVTTFTGQVVDVTPPGALTYDSGWHMLSRVESRLDVYNPWPDSCVVSTTVTKGYDISQRHWIDSKGNEFFVRKITPNTEPAKVRLGEGGLDTFILPPGPHKLDIRRQRENGTWYHLATITLVARGDGHIYYEDGRMISNNFPIPHPGDAVSTSAVEIK